MSYHEESYKAKKLTEDFADERVEIQPVRLEQIRGRALPKLTYDFYLQDPEIEMLKKDFLKNNNPYIIKQRLGLEYVLETQGVTCYYTTVAIFIHLYYVDLMEECFGYIREACRACDVYISTSVETIAEYIEGECEKCNIKNCKIEIINNRGQDIAALLLYHAKTMKKYQYVCFVHDKKSSSYVAEEDGYLWFRTIWENMLASQGYITNIIREFEKDKRLGMLSVPEPFWGDCLRSVENGWVTNFNETYALAERLGLVCKPEKCYPPITIGTAFWARSDSILPILNEPFTLEEFPDQGAGALSYAVERILPFVVQSCGGYTGIVETKKFSVFKMMYLQNLVMRTEGLLRRRFNIYNEVELEEAQIPYDKVETFSSGFAHVYMYGTGKKATALLRTYSYLLDIIDGFVETEPDDAEEFFCGKKIFSAKSVIREGTGFILAMAEKTAKEVVQYLVNNGVHPTHMLLLSPISITNRRLMDYENCFIWHRKGF